MSAPLISSQVYRDGVGMSMKAIVEAHGRGLKAGGQYQARAG
jgi:hypothetical protein